MNVNPASDHLLRLLQITWPIIQAPMAGISTPSMAAAVSNAGGLGSLGVGAMTASAAAASAAAFRELSRASLNVNVFCHRPPTENAPAEADWLQRLRPEFEKVGSEPPASISDIHKSFVEDDLMLATIIAARPRAVSFHFGLPPEAAIRALREAGIILLGTATSHPEARILEKSGVHAVVAQGYEPGGHQGVFDPDAADDQLGTLPLTRLLVRNLGVPVIAAGGIMDGAGIASVLHLGAAAAQLGTALLATDESAADEGYRRALLSDAANHTMMTRHLRPPGVLSGKPVHGLRHTGGPNRYSALPDCLRGRQGPACGGKSDR